MSTINLPDYKVYKDLVELEVSRGKLDVDQAVLLLAIYRNHLRGKPTNIRVLMNEANLNWKMVNAKLNGLVMKGGCKKIDKYWYSL
jgi:predicted transcriptional regulator